MVSSTTKTMVSSSSSSSKKSKSSSSSNSDKDNNNNSYQKSKSSNNLSGSGVNNNSSSNKAMTVTKSGHTKKKTGPKTGHSRSYPRGVGLDFRKLAGLTLVSYIDHHGKCAVHLRVRLYSDDDMTVLVFLLFVSR